MTTQPTLDFEPRPPTSTTERQPEVVPHPTGGWTHAVPVPGSSIRVYEGWWHLKKKAEARLLNRFPHLAPPPTKVSAARQSSAPLALPKTDEALMAQPA